MSNRIFFDSSLLIEYRKGNHTELFESLVSHSDWLPCISQIVVSEYLYHHLAIFGGKAPLSIKTAKEIENILVANDPTLFLEQFKWLKDDENIRKLSITLMAKYNLMPNDALIISICKVHKVKFLASLDIDFKAVCLQEKITLVSHIHDLDRIKEEDDEDSFGLIEL